MLEVHPKNICTVINIMKYVHRCNTLLGKFWMSSYTTPIIEGRLKEKSPKWILVSRFYIALEALTSL